MDSESLLIRQKKDKCAEIFRNNSDIRDLITSNEENPVGHDLGQIIDMLYDNQHFINCK